ncbi:MAG: YcaO-like family protein [Planctomycetes bacterium]|nr:YcaO-like family protein [Planctomycetota bacterium]
MDCRLDNPYTGLFVTLGAPPVRAQDPDASLWAGSLAPIGTRGDVIHVGGAGWTPEDARLACLGEAIERFHTSPLAEDRVIEASWETWRGIEPAVPSDRWVLFHAEQYAQPGFPFHPFRRDTVCRWIAFREALTGGAVWVPEEFGFLFPRAEGFHRLGPSISTGLSCGRWGDPVLLRGLQEVIERDGIIGAWWKRYRLEEWSAESVFEILGEDTRRRVVRPHMKYRFYRVDSPFSAHVTIITVEGEDREGWLFCAGAACRETREASWRKALLEAVQGWHYVRFLKARKPEAAEAARSPNDFADHALFYTLFPERLGRTVLRRASPPRSSGPAAEREGIEVLSRRLGPDRPILFRIVTPPSVATAAPEWYVLKVVVPGLQPLHGHHTMPLLGGPLWAPRGLAEWADMEPHPFP